MICTREDEGDKDVRHLESLCGTLERRFIQRLVLAVARSSSDDERQRLLCALRDLVTSADPTMDVTLLDAWTRAEVARMEIRAWLHEPIALHPDALTPRGDEA